MHPATQAFMEGLRKLCDEKGLLLLLDEVQTGWGRTGSVMAYMGYGIKPDAVSMAKAMGGGMPIGACCARKEVAQALGAGTHGSTYGGSPIACAAALASVSEILDRHLSENAAEVGAYMIRRLAALPHVKEARGRGLLVGVEYDIPIAMEVKWGTFRRGRPDHGHRGQREPDGAAPDRHEGRRGRADHKDARRHRGGGPGGAGGVK